MSPQIFRQLMESSSPEIEQSNRYMLVITSSVGQLTLRPGGYSGRESLGGENVFQNPQMSAVFPPPPGVIHYGGATLMELDE